LYISITNISNKPYPSRSTDNWTGDYPWRLIVHQQRHRGLIVHQRRNRPSERNKKRIMDFFY